VASIFGVVLLGLVVAGGLYVYWKAERLSQEIDREQKQK
jgi:hypothetical protein